MRTRIQNQNFDMTKIPEAKSEIEMTNQKQTFVVQLTE